MISKILAVIVWGISYSIGGGHERNNSWSYIVVQYGRPSLNHLSLTDQDTSPCLEIQYRYKYKFHRYKYKFCIDGIAFTCRTLRIGIYNPCQSPGGCFTNVLWALQNNLAKIYSVKNHIFSENFKLKLCTCAQSMALGTRTKFQLEILIKRRFLQYTNFEIIFWRARETLVKQPPGTWLKCSC